MKNKKILIASAIIGIALVILSLGIKESIPSADRKGLLAYNHKASNVLDNIYKTNNTVILPIIYQSSDEEPITRQEVMEDIQSRETISSMPPNLQSPVATGDKFVTNKATYNVIVFGDANKDGWINVLDIRSMILYCLEKETYPLENLAITAANIYNEDDTVNVLDIRRLILFCLKNENDLVVIDPISEKEKDSVPPVITLKGSSTVTVYKGNAYTDAGATAKDAVDGNVTVSADTSKVNVNKVGEYTVTYTATDKTGNKATATRKVIVKEDVISSISVKTNPTKTEYKYNESLNLSGGVLNVKWQSGKTTTVNMTDSSVTVTGYNKTSIKTQTLTAKYSGKTTTFTVKVVDYNTGIIVTAPENLTSNLGEDINLTNVKFKYQLASGGTSAEKAVTTSMISGFDKNSRTTQTVKVTVSGFTDTFKVTVIDHISSISISSTPTIREYKFNEAEELDLTDGQVTINWAGGDIETIPMSHDSITISGYNPTSVGTQTITVTHTSGKKATFTIEVVDYNTGIIVTAPEGLTSKVGEDIDLTNVKFKYKLASGGTSAEKEVTMGMIDDFNPMDLSKQTVTVIVDGFEATFEVEVVDYVSYIEIAQASTHKEEFKYGEEFSAEGLKVIGKYFGGSDDLEIELDDLTIDSSAYNSKPNKDKLNEPQTIKITYEDCEPVEYYVTIVDYIERIEIVDENSEYKDEYALTAHKTEFILNDTFTAENLSVVGIYAGPTGTTAIIPTELTFSGNDLSSVGEKTVTITYNDNLTATYTITVVKELESLVLTPSAHPIMGYRYDEITIGTLAAGQDQKAITSDDVTYTVTKSGADASNLVTITKTGNGTVTLKLTADETGTYIVTPSANGITGPENNKIFTVNVYKNPEVNKITISDATTGTIRVDKHNIFKITFEHEYEEKGTSDILDVPANKVSVTGLEDGTYELMTGENADEAIENTISFVTGIAVLPTETTEQDESLTFKVGIQNTEISQEKTIQVEEALKYAVVLEDNPTDITLYHTDPGLDLIESTDTGNIYTLVKASLKDQEENEKAITVAEINDKTLKITDSISSLVQNITIAGFIYDEEEGKYIIPESGDIEYIGISISIGNLEQATESKLNGAIITMVYDGNTAHSTKLNVIVPARKLQNIVATPNEDLTREIYETFEIATMESGSNEPELTSDDFYITVKDQNNNDTIIYDTNPENIVNNDNIKISFESSKLKFMAKQQGIYSLTITPKDQEVKINNNNILNINNIVISESTVVNSVTFSGTNGELTESSEDTINITIPNGEAFEINMECKHIYTIDESNTEEVDIIVSFKDITVTKNPNTDAIDCILLDNQDDEALNPTDKVEKIMLFSETAGDYTVTISFDGGLTKTINVTVE